MMHIDVSQLGEQTQKAFDGFCEKAKDFVEDPQKLEKLIQQFEKKLKDVPNIGEYLSDVAVMMSLARSYALGEYRHIPVGSVVAVVAAILYTVSPIDFIPDAIPVAGLMDDAGVIGLVAIAVHGDLQDYKAWREASGKVIV